MQCDEKTLIKSPDMFFESRTYINLTCFLNMRLSRVSGLEDVLNVFCVTGSGSVQHHLCINVPYCSIYY